MPLIHRVAVGDVRLPIVCQAVIELAHHTAFLGQLDSAIQLAIRAEKAAAQREIHRQAKAAGMVGFAQFQRGMFAESIAPLERGLNLARESADSRQMMFILRYLGGALGILERVQAGRAYLEEALLVARQLNDRLNEQRLLLYIGVIDVENHHYEQAYIHFKAALAMIEETADKSLEARIANAVGYTLARLEQFAEALPYHERSRRLAHEMRQPFQESHALHNLCTVKRKMGNLADAERDGLEALRLAQIHQLHDPESYAYLHLGYVWLALNRPNAAHDAFARSRDGWHAQNRSALALEAQLGIAAVALRRQSVDAAWAIVEPILDQIADGLPSGIDEPQEINATIYQTLTAIQDSRAAQFV